MCYFNKFMYPPLTKVHKYCTVFCIKEWNTYM